MGHGGFTAVGFVTHLVTHWEQILLFVPPRDFRMAHLALPSDQCPTALLEDVWCLTQEMLCTQLSCHIPESNSCAKSVSDASGTCKVQTLLQRKREQK